MSGIPEIRTDRGIPTLYVKDVPFFALSGEVHNSSAESLSYMEKKVWPRIAGMNLNTLVVPLYWNRIEAQEGIFDFTLLDLSGKRAEEAFGFFMVWVMEKCGIHLCA